MTLKLPRAPKEYEQADQAKMRTTLEQNDLRVLRGGQDVHLTQGEQVIQTYAAGLTAHAGGGKASALQLTARINHIGTVASANDSVMLPPAIAGLMRTIINYGAHACQVFGHGTDTINGVATGTGVSQSGNMVATYYCPATGAWFV